MEDSKEAGQFWSIQHNLKMTADVPQPSSKFHTGISYRDYLKQIHEVLNPSSYVEIGVKSGSTLAFARCRAVAIDPVIQFTGNPIGKRLETYIFQMTSDDFFAKHDLRTFLPDWVDFAFLDGMHHFEFLLRDFMNIEKYSHKGSVVTLHDCLPVNAEIADRDPNPGRRSDRETVNWWAGDVWKLIPILRDHRPDLDVTALDCPPTGLVVVKGLDRSNKVLAGVYDEIIAKYQSLTLATFGMERFRAEFPTVDSRQFYTSDGLQSFLRRWA